MKSSVVSLFRDTVDMDCCSDYLIYCARESDEGEIKRLIAEGVTGNEKDCDGVTPPPTLDGMWRKTPVCQNCHTFA